MRQAVMAIKKQPPAEIVALAICERLNKEPTEENLSIAIKLVNGKRAREAAAEAKAEGPIGGEDAENFHVLATRCRLAGKRPTHDNMKLMNNTKLESQLGRMSLAIPGHIPPGLLNAGMDYAGMEESWRAMKGLPSRYPGNTFWREAVTAGVDGDAPPESLDTPEERLRRLTGALSEARKALRDAGAFAERWTLALLREEHSDAMFYQRVHGVMLITSRGEFAKWGLQALADHFRIEWREE